jgi:hypothetical protein
MVPVAWPAFGCLDSVNPCLVYTAWRAQLPLLATSHVCKLSMGPVLRSTGFGEVASTVYALKVDNEQHWRGSRRERGITLAWATQYRISPL